MSTCMTFTRIIVLHLVILIYNSDTTQYEKKDKYEFTVQDPKVVGEEGRSTYVVDSTNELIMLARIGTGVETSGYSGSNRTLPYL